MRIAFLGALTLAAFQLAPHHAGDLVDGTIATVRLGSGTANSSTFLRGDQTWAAPPAGGGGLDAGLIVLSLTSTAAETLPTGSTGVATGTTAGPGAALTHSVTQPSAHTFTQPTFAGTQFDNRPAFVRVIFCKKS